MFIVCFILKKCFSNFCKIPTQSLTVPEVINMPVIKKIKDKLYNSSYDPKKTNRELDNLRKEFKAYKKENDRIIKSNNEFFNRIFLDFELKPKGALKLIQELCLELLDFYANVCNKHDLEFWLDFGNLLGAVRHGSYIPWDDDIDVGMMRKDSLKFNEIFMDEVKLHNMDDMISISKQRVTTRTNLRPFSQIKILKKNVLYGCLDIFPYDYIINPSESTEQKYLNAKVEYYNNIYDGMSKNEVLKIFYDDLNCSYDEQEYLLPSIEGPFGKNKYKFKLFRKDKIFPLGKVEYGGRIYPAPNDINDYLNKIYGENYMRIPKIISYHERLNFLRNEENLEENYSYFIKRMKKVNEEF